MDQQTILVAAATALRAIGYAARAEAGCIVVKYGGRALIVDSFEAAVLAVETLRAS